MGGTYVSHDFDRTDQFGRKRALHVKDALDAIDYTYYSEYKTKYTDQIDVPVEIVRSLYFTTNKILLNTRFERDIEILDSFVIYICLEGNGNIQYVGGNTSIKMGDVLLVPASLKRLTLVPDPNLKLLETYITV